MHGMTCNCSFGNCLLVQRSPLAELLQYSRSMKLSVVAAAAAVVGCHAFNIAPSKPQFSSGGLSNFSLPSWSLAYFTILLNG
jgi:hypothetical protein